VLAQSLYPVYRHCFFHCRFALRLAHHFVADLAWLHQNFAVGFAHHFFARLVIRRRLGFVALAADSVIAQPVLGCLRLV